MPIHSADRTHSALWQRLHRWLIGHRDDLEPPPPARITRGSGTADAVTETRAHQRFPVRWPVRCHDRNGVSWSAMVKDSSLGGFGLTECPALQRGDAVHIELEGIGAFTCRVAWSRGAACGVELLDDTSAASALALARVLVALADEGSLASR
jgi:hypothetical protein